MAERDDPAYARAPEPDDLVRICRALNDEGARYVLIGGLAMAAHGAARFTKDRDHVVVRVIDEVVIDLMGRACGLTYEDVANDMESHEIGGTIIHVASPSTLLKTKDTYRPQDAIDRGFLATLLRDRGR